MRVLYCLQKSCGWAFSEGVVMNVFVIYRFGAEFSRTGSRNGFIEACDISFQPFRACRTVSLLSTYILNPKPKPYMNIHG